MTPKIIKEGTIKIMPDGEIRAEDFCVEGMTFQDLQQLVQQRVRLAVYRSGPLLHRILFR